MEDREHRRPLEVPESLVDLVSREIARALPEGWSLVGGEWPGREWPTRAARRPNWEVFPPGEHHSHTAYLSYSIYLIEDFYGVVEDSYGASMLDGSRSGGPPPPPVLPPVLVITHGNSDAGPVAVSSFNATIIDVHPEGHPWSGWISEDLASVFEHHGPNHWGLT